MAEGGEIPLSEIKPSVKKKGGGPEGWRRERARQIVRENPGINPHKKKLGGGEQGRKDEAARTELRKILRGENNPPQK